MEKYRCKRTIKYLIIHCSATRVTTNFTVERLRTLHVKQNGWLNLRQRSDVAKKAVSPDKRRRPNNISNSRLA